MLGSGWRSWRHDPLSPWRGREKQLTVVAKPLKTHPDTLSYAVGYSDLDLGTEKGRKELADRIQIAAAYVCKKVDAPIPPSLESRKPPAQCWRLF
jgi:UrcA family protein